MKEPVRQGAYRDGAELESDTSALITSLNASRSQATLVEEVQRWLDLTRVFGLNLTRLDVRQDARVYRNVMTQLLRISGDCENFDGWMNCKGRQFWADDGACPPFR